MPALPKRAKLPALTEKHVTEAVIGWLRAHNWLCVRLQSGLVDLPGARKMRVGTPGLPDWACFKGSRYCFIELKRPGKTLSSDQKIWFALAQKNKINCLWADGLGSFLAKWEIEPCSVER